MPNSDDSGLQGPLVLEAVSVKVGRLVCDVRIENREYRQTNARLAEFVMRDYPDLAHHTCINGIAPTFGAVIESTSVAHLLEHVVISMQTHASEDRHARFTGTTEWLDEAAGRARVEVSFMDDLEALRAFAEATRFLNNAVLTCLP